MTNGVVNSSDLMLFVNGSAIACQTNAEWSITRSFRDTTCKQSGIFKAQLPSILEFNVSGEAWVNYAASTPNVSTVLDLIIDGTLCGLALKTGVSGDDVLYGQGYLSSYTLTSSGTNENAAFSYEFMGTGAVAVS